MTLLAVNIAIGVYAVATYKPPEALCVMGIVMVQDKNKDMYVQQGLWPTYCVAIDKD
jgi:hypothetical protein